MKTVETAIIGGGFSGLFFAHGLLQRGYESFCLIERDKKSLGGFASRGGIKVGLLPAGEKTKRALNCKDYRSLQSRFLSEYDDKLIKIQKRRLNQEFKFESLHNKYYESYILTQKNAFLILKKLKHSLKRKILYSSLRKIEKNGKFYVLSLENGKNIQCNNLVISSGRDPGIVDIMTGIGQQYNRKHDMLFGCRATFESRSATHLFEFQPDFRIKDTNTFQTYCFNYRGDLTAYDYKKFRIYAGSFKEHGDIGNCFIGRRLISIPDLILKKYTNIHHFNFIDLQNKRSKYPNSEIKKLCNFLRILECNTGIKFLDLYFPALEQFWPRPKLKPASLESSSLRSVFFIGDSSGISFGFIQCYITANLLLKKILP